MDASDAKRLKAAGRRECRTQEASGRDDAGQRDPEGREPPTVVTPTGKRKAAAYASAAHDMSEWRAYQARWRAAVRGGFALLFVVM